MITHVLKYMVFRIKELSGDNFREYHYDYLKKMLSFRHIKFSLPSLQKQSKNQIPYEVHLHSCLITNLDIV